MDDITYQFIIDTDLYAGNFERELCAYITGYWDEETNGEDQAEVFKKEVGDPENIFEDYILLTLVDDDDVPNYAYQTIMPGPNTADHNSVAIFFEKRPTTEMIKLMKERSYKFEKEGLIFDEPVELKIVGFRLMKKTTITEYIPI